MNSTIDIIKNRMSLRKYQNKPISKEHLDIIIESAMRAPTAGNMMLYSILIVEDEEKREKLSITCDNQSFIAKAPLVLIFLADMQRWYDYYNYCDVKEYCKRNQIEFRAPDEADLLLASSDAIIAAQNAVIAAESLGIGSCYIGDIMENYEVHKEMFNLPDKVFPIAMLCMGYYPLDIKRRIKPRFDRKYIVFNESYKRLKNKELEDMFKNRKVKENNKYNAKNFGQYFYARKTGADFAKEMSRSVKEALEFWKKEI
ncbi:nitroreductase family protein [Thermohalobacter berrensis]|uniref:Nitroreductase n=1 Tax=Thermohalobacter berrensis TaxID=99594 RepID=A0A419T9X6_9FIRM|nr:nitroreductase family protein [Thermohalobacter berrensis]RKD34265.1 nitroreductase [Thermohalobacter berrensis]